MKNKKNKAIGKKQAGIYLGLLTSIVVISVILANINVITQELEPDEVVEPSWHTIMVIKPGVRPVGENFTGQGKSGWGCTFCLDYGETVATVLANNATDWENISTVHGYEDVDGQTTDLVSEDPFYFVVRCKFNRTVCYTGGNFIGTRCRATLTVSGDETIDLTHYCNNSADTLGGAIESDNNSNNGSIYINFFWDDDVDGYRILDDGSLVWAVVIEAKY